jgi:hypothetical protein
VAYIVKDRTGRELNRKVNIESLKVVNYATIVADSTLSAGEEESQYAFVEEILDHRNSKKNNGYEYLVRWADTEEDEDEWIDERDFNGTDMIAHYWDEILPKG